MKKILLLCVGVFAFAHLFATGGGYDVQFAQPAQGTYILNFELQDYNIADIRIDGTIYTNIIFDGSVKTNKKGYAALPFLSASVQLSAKNNVDISVTAKDYVEYDLTYPLLPSRGVIYRDQDPSTIPYEIDPKSITNSWYPEKNYQKHRSFYHP